MATPFGYNLEQVLEVLSKHNDFRLYHHTPVSNLESICKSKGIYSIGTLWGLDPTLRMSQPGNKSYVSAKNGFIDYVYLSKVNRITEQLPTIFGQLCFRVQPEILKDKESFVYPFNTGFDWDKPSKKNFKKSDASTLERCILSEYITDEFLVRRKVSFEYIDGVYCFSKDYNQVQKLLVEYGWHIDVIEVKKSSSCIYYRPDYSIEIWKSGGSQTASAENLFINSERPNILIYHDNESNCYSDFVINESGLFDRLDSKCKLGAILNAKENKKAS